MDERKVRVLVSERDAKEMLEKLNRQLSVAKMWKDCADCYNAAQFTSDEAAKKAYLSAAERLENAIEIFEYLETCDFAKGKNIG